MSVCNLALKKNGVPSTLTYHKNNNLEENIMGTIIEISIFMLVIASVAFAPLGYFIYNYTKKDGEPFGDFEHPEVHSHSIIDELAEKAKEKLH